MSGLKVSPSKSELSCCGVSNEQQIQLEYIIGFKHGALPVRYLGLPLITGKLEREDYKPLVEKMTSRVTYWSPRLLSFPGRMQLINSALSSMYNYCCNIVT